MNSSQSKLNTLLPHLAMFSVALIYAGNYTLAKAVMPEPIGPQAFILMRGGFAVLVFWLLHFVGFNERVERSDMPLLALSGLFGVAANQLMFFKGLNLTTPINASLLMMTTPILVLVISAFLLKESITRLKLLGILLGIAGAALLITSKSATQPNMSAANPLLGNILVVLNALSFGVFLVIVKPLMAKYKPLTVMKWVFSFGLIGVLPMGYNEFSQVNWAVFTLSTWLIVAYVLIGVTILAYLLNAYALSKVNPSVVGTYIYLQPLLATIIALIAGKDQLAWPMLWSALAIFAGVWMVSRER